MVFLNAAEMAYVETSVLFQRLSEDNLGGGAPGPGLSAGLVCSLRLAFLQVMLFTGQPSSHLAANP